MIQIVLLRPGSDGQTVHLHPTGFPKGLVVPNTDILFSQLGAILAKLREKDPDNLKNVYYTVAHHTGVGGPVPVRREVSFTHQTVIPFDLDYVDSERAWDYLPVVAKVLKLSPHSLIFVSTGNGLHIIAHLETEIRSAKYLKETKPHYNELVYQINRELEARGLPGKADPAIWDAARILRLPNTTNEKKGVSKEAKLLQYPGLVPQNLDLRKLSGLDEVLQRNISPRELKKNYPKPDFQEVVKQCEFLKWATEKPEEVHEPHFMSALGLLGAMNPGDKIRLNGLDISAKETAQHIFEGACNSNSLARDNFDKKWEHGIRYGAPRCETVSQSWLGGCEKCPHFHKINTPLALKSEDHIQSAENGYWVMGQKAPLNPHYSDLKKVYTKQNAYVSVDPDRIFTFQDTHYYPTTHLQVKAWLDRTVGYEEYLRDTHCNEFVKKLLRSRTLSLEAEKDFFERSIAGKINCLNGVLDVRSGVLAPSDPNLGFKYVLPYGYEEGQVSEFFLDWLATMMQNRTELMDSLLDMMAYSFWPTYDDHVFMYLVGEGKNGKSTLLHILQSLIGKQNFSAISIFQLGGNRFAPANLEGKLVNISGESSGADLSFQELNVIKELSAGGELEVERKGQQGFTLRNKAKLIFSANKPPRFHEQGMAVQRRLLCIPFDYTIENEDSKVEDRLIAEVPKIFSMLVNRIQENIKANGGSFKVSRGGAPAASAQERVLRAGNSVFEWGKENIESDLTVPEESYISVIEAYTHYSKWCQENGHKPFNSSTFGYHMVRGVLSGAVREAKNKRVGNKVARIYPRTRFKEQAL